MSLYVYFVALIAWLGMSGIVRGDVTLGAGPNGLEVNGVDLGAHLAALEAEMAILSKALADRTAELEELTQTVTGTAPISSTSSSETTQYVYPFDASVDDSNFTLATFFRPFFSTPQDTTVCKFSYVLGIEWDCAFDFEAHPKFTWEDSFQEASDIRYYMAEGNPLPNGLALDPSLGRLSGSLDAATIAGYGPDAIQLNYTMYAVLYGYPQPVNFNLQFINDTLMDGVETTGAVTKTLDEVSQRHIWTWTGDGTCTISLDGFSGHLDVRFLLVGGGGGGASGGGGAGGVIEYQTYTLVPGEVFTIDIGAGGRGAEHPGSFTNRALAGENTILSSDVNGTITAYGGGNGAIASVNAEAGIFGSGGGAGGFPTSTTASDGTPGQGFDGGGQPSTGYCGGGGGSATEPGVDGTVTVPGAGGAAYYTDITGVSQPVAAGGGACCYASNADESSTALGGVGGGGDCLSANNPTHTQNGTTYGSGGGGLTQSDAPGLGGFGFPGVFILSIGLPN